MGKTRGVTQSLIPLRTMVLFGTVALLLAAWLFGVQHQIAQVVERGEIIEASELLAAEVAALESTFNEQFTVALEAEVAEGTFVRETAPIYVARTPSTHTAVNN